MNAHLKKQLSLDSDHDSDVNPGAPYLSSYQNQKIQSYGTMPISHSSTLQTKNSLGGREKYSNVPHMNEEENKTLLDNRNNLNDIESIRLSQSVENFDEDAKLLAGNRSLRTGRHRKKLAARSKGGEFQARRRKRRVYFCCISSEIDMQKLHEYLTGAEELFFKGWSFNIYGDVLHMFKPGVASLLPLQSENGQGDATINPPPPPLERALSTGDMSNTDCYTSETNTASNARDMQQPRRRNVGESAYSSDGEFVSPGLESLPNPNSGSRYTENPLDTQDRISAVGAQEVFVFDFGAAVCWSFSKGEEARILKVLRMFVTKGTVLGAEFENGEDDMAFICSPDVDSMTIANDMITLPENCTVKQRLSASFAIAQSTVLSIFENRIENKIEDYKYIPETLAACGKVQLSQRQLGVMIGEVFVIRHDVNLHSEILDTPDFFWKEEKYEQDYRMVFDYLEMKSRTDVSNTRLDMLRELLNVLQQQMENAHAVKLEWIVIWLIVVEVVLQLVAIFGTRE